MTDKHREWIDKADYEQMLRRWRFAPPRSDIFQYLIGEYYLREMQRKKGELQEGQAAEISEKIGWDSPTPDSETFPDP